jgi:3-(3-hydroxy-phenyl)propionate hydroxylase
MAETDRVLIVGAGPVGAMTGYALARQGVPVTLFEAAAKPSEDHRAATLHAATLDLFAPYGLTDTIIAQGIPSRHFQYRDRVSQEIVAEFDFDRLSSIADHPFVVQLEQHKTVNIILEAARVLPAFTLHRPVQVLAVRQLADHVEVDADHDGETVTHRGRYLVGCDGGRSLVRKTSGASFDGFTWPERFCIVSTTFDFERRYGYRFRNYCAHPERWAALFKVPGPDNDGVWRTVLPTKTEESDEEVLSDAWILARYAECFPEAGAIPIVHRNLYNVHQRVAGSFAVGRIALAGDSAHVNNPLGGMGMNSGFQDGINLAGKLVEVWKGADAEPLLAQYDRQRRLTAMEYVQAQSIANKKMLEESDDEKRRAALDELRRRAEDPQQHFEFVKRSSLIAMWEKSESIE